MQGISQALGSEYAGAVPARGLREWACGVQAPQSVAVFDIAGARVERDDEFLEVELTSGEDLQLRALSLGAARGWELALRHAATS